jgi:hypothetical protein
MEKSQRKPDQWDSIYRGTLSSSLPDIGMASLLGGICLDPIKSRDLRTSVAVPEIRSSRASSQISLHSMARGTS